MSSELEKLIEKNLEKVQERVEAKGRKLRSSKLRLLLRS